ncbi:MAG: glutamine amidotransferase [Desulfosalsimonas sp.]|uniref:glutamine amidotransferase n=1 Tax=Desulfosalsimonas sp. TaxID=3073848 RepID=UPI00397074FB
MKKLCIIKLGTTYADMKSRFGDFEHWTQNGLDAPGAFVRIVDAKNGQGLPAPEKCAGAVLTGSHAMATDNAEWSVRTENWLKELLHVGVPVLGICYGHHLLARAAGGKAGYHPRGREVGTVQIRVFPGAAGSDPLFSAMPKRFFAHATHSQTVFKLPPGAVHLAQSDHDPYHAFRIGGRAWGVQFHPEFSAEIMRAYIDKQADDLIREGRSPEHLLQNVTPTPEAPAILSAFARLC